MTGTYMSLSNIYASQGRWEDSSQVRVAAKTRGLRKIPGQSRTEVKKKSYIFSSGNSFQSGLDKVYEILDDLGPRMEAEGYVPDKSFVLQVVGDEEKKERLNGHSEKLLIFLQTFQFESQRIFGFVGTAITGLRFSQKWQNVKLLLEMDVVFTISKMGYVLAEILVNL
ncbi:pentatricopeptide repeat-containing protein At4g02750-like [Papaver somniferum]|uniref:pentatricopeptide repeat-containing protein At4g02750-like n=1 Tax=Papaver somniferum TaxID=3469 RepID=UPI000E6FFC08|nr:pentatricopeptide repeat-containing protein At4g02750-like [Papaver somniferum]